MPRPFIERRLFVLRDLHFEAAPNSKRRCRVCSDCLVASDGLDFCMAHYPEPAQLEMELGA